MRISDSLTQQRVQEILMYIYIKGNISKTIDAKEAIEEIKQQILQCEPQKRGAINIEKII